MLTQSAYATFLVLRDMLQGGAQRIPVHELAYRRDVSEKKICIDIGQLEAAGLVTVNRSLHGCSNLYTLTPSAGGKCNL